MGFFLWTKPAYGLDDVMNFQTFGRSMIVLFQISTSAGWNSVLAGLSIQPPHCNATSSSGVENDCGNPSVAVMFLLSYLFITFLIVINMYIAVILENFSQAQEDAQEGLTEDDFDMYYEVWEKFDVKGSHYIRLDQLCDLVDTLEDPLRIQKPNKIKLVTMNIPICSGERVHCVDILDALTKNFLGTTGDLGDIPAEEAIVSRQNYEPVTTLLERQQHNYASATIQRAWRTFQKRKDEGWQPPPMKSLKSLATEGVDVQRVPSSGSKHSVCSHKTKSSSKQTITPSSSKHSMDAFKIHSTKQKLPTSSSKTSVELQKLPTSDSKQSIEGATAMLPSSASRHTMDAMSMSSSRHSMHPETRQDSDCVITIEEHDVVKNSES